MTKIGILDNFLIHDTTKSDGANPVRLKVDNIYNDRTGSIAS